jgi:tetratricopeptide (TPR) repeat protein
MDRANAYRHSGDIDQAMDDYRLARRLAPQDPWVFDGLGTTYMQKGYYDDAIAELSEAISLAESSSAGSGRWAGPFYLDRGYAYEAEGKEDKAIEDFSAAIKLDPHYPAALGARARAYTAIGQHDHAIADLDIVVQDNPGLAKAYIDRGNAYAAKPDLAKAFQDYDHAIAVDPQDPEAFLVRGVAHAEKPDFERAISDLTQAITLDPRYEVAFLNRGFVYAAQGNRESAFRDYDKVAQINLRNPLGWIARGNFYESGGQYDSALQEYNTAIDVDPGSAAAHTARSAVFMSKRQYRDAIKDLDRALQIVPSDKAVLAARGMGYFYLREFDRAIVDYDAALRIDPKFAVALYGRGQAKIEKGQGDAGNLDIAEASEIQPNVGAEFSRWAGWRRRLANQLAGYDTELGLQILTVSAGTVVVATILAESWLLALATAAAIAGLGGLLLGTGLPAQGPLTDPANFLLVVGAFILTLSGGLALAAVVRLGLFRRREGSRIARLTHWTRDRLLPHRWPIPQRMPVTRTDLAKRIFVTVSGATGGVVGSLASLRVFWENLGDVFTPQGVLTALVLTLVSVVLIRPLHEYVLDRGLSEVALSETPQDVLTLGLASTLSWRALVRILIVFLCLLQLDIIYSSLDLCIQRGSTEATSRVIFGGLVPGIVSFYWGAGLQLGARSLIKSTVWPTTMFAAFVYYPALVAEIMSQVFERTLWPQEWPIIVAVLLGALVGAIALTLLFSSLFFGVTALAGGFAIDRARGPHAMAALTGMLLLAGVVSEAAHALVVIGERADLTWYDAWYGFPQRIGWVLGLFASSFPQLVRRPATAMSS